MPENQAGFEPGPGPDQNKISIFFSKNQIRNKARSARERTTYVREKGGVKKDSNRGTPCILPAGVPSN